jgi:hypothetical protein
MHFVGDGRRIIYCNQIKGHYGEITFHPMLRVIRGYE